MSDKKAVLMTGATGLVGSRFIEMYSSQYEIYNMDLTTGVDITNQDSIEQFVISHPAKIMIHLAAFTNTVAASEQDGDKSGICYQVNVEGTQNITQVCHKHNIHLVHVSTDFVFGGDLDRPYTETDSVDPVDWYGKTKSMAEQVVQESEAGYTIARISYPYRKEFATKPDLVKKIRDSLLQDSLPPQFSDSTITPTFIDDIARGFSSIIEQEPRGIYHLVGSTSLSPYQLAQKVAHAYGLDESLVREGSLTEYLRSTNRSFARHVAVSNAKAVKDLDLTFMTIDEGLLTITS